MQQKRAIHPANDTSSKVSTPQGGHQSRVDEACCGLLAWACLRYGFKPKSCTTSCAQHLSARARAFRHNRFEARGRDCRQSEHSSATSTSLNCFGRSMVRIWLACAGHMLRSSVTSRGPSRQSRDNRWGFPVSRPATQPFGLQLPGRSKVSWQGRRMSNDNGQ